MSDNKVVVTYGIDLAKSVFHICGLDQHGKIVVSRKLRRNQAIIYFSKQSACKVAMEACAGAHWIARKLAALDYDVRILPAQYVKPFAQQQKNDANDALAIAEACQRPSVKPVPIKTLEQQHLQAMHRVRDRLVNQRTRLVNQMRGFLLEYGITIRGGIGNFRAQLPDILATDNEDLTPGMLGLLESLLSEFLDLDEKAKNITRQIEAWAARDETARRLQTIPGIGPLSATAIIAAVGNANQFRRARDLSAWLGLVPKQHSTGGKTTLGGISKRGNGYIRRLLIHGARSCTLHLNREKDKLGQWMDELSQRKPFNKVVVALANKLARIAWVILVKPGATYKRVDPILVS